ncbi:catechol 2,3-dioxygenase-like lactoylglutathione lyase family enzyme [Mycobacterium sp. URHB0021]
MALILGFSLSARARASCWSSPADTSPEATRPARPRPSTSTYSSSVITPARSNGRMATDALHSIEPGRNQRTRDEVAVRLDLLTPAIEVGVVTTNLDAMAAFYEGFLGLQFQGSVDFPGGTQRRYALGKNVVKLVTFAAAPPQPAAAGGGPARAGIRYFTIGVNNLRAVAEAVEAPEYQVVEPLTEFEPVPGMGWLYIADPDGNWIELFGTL